MNRQNLKNAKRIVIKIGTRILVSREAYLNKKIISDFAAQISKLLKKDYEIIVVSSGAIGAGMHLMGLKNRPKVLPELQACAALGQGHLIKTYEDSFNRNGFHAAQVLLTEEDLKERDRHWNASNTLNALLRKRIVPVVNENDTVSIDEIRFGDNDALSARLSNFVKADLLIMLTDVEGFCIDNKCVDIVREIDLNIKRQALEAKSEFSRGGMRTKLEACSIAMSSGVHCVIADGRSKDIILKVVSGEKVGTLFVPKKNKMSIKKGWIAYNARVQGNITVDEGARDALINKNRSLLASGIKSIEGDFKSGAIISINFGNCAPFAKGVSNYSSQDLEIIKGKTSRQIGKIIDKGFYEEAVHRDNLVIL